MVGIVLVIRFIHSCNIIHYDLAPQYLLLGWGWNVRISDFSHSVSDDLPPADHCPDRLWPSVGSDGSRCIALECYEGNIVVESDVFSFLMIPYEPISGRPVFPKRKTRCQILEALINGGWEPDIPESVVPEAAELIRDCLADRPLFTDTLNRLNAIGFTAMKSAEILHANHQEDHAPTDQIKSTNTV